MREILFRGKDPETGGWHEGHYIYLHKTTYCFAGSKERDEENEIHQIVFEYMTDWNLPNRHLRADVLPETVGQYTGLTDKNGKKIFEGDIVMGLFLHSCPVKSVVSFQGGAFGLLWEMAGVETFWAFTSICNVEYEVIGNIHDNPELLEGE